MSPFAEVTPTDVFSRDHPMTVGQVNASAVDVAFKANEQTEFG